MSGTVSRIFHTVRHMTGRQWKYRLYYTARNKLKKRMPKKPDHPLSVFLLPAQYGTNLEIKDTRTADAILQNRIPTVSGMTCHFEGDWDLKGENYRLVSFRLNSFRWLLDLSDAYKATGERKYIEKGLELIRSWQDQCGAVILGDKWNAYVIAERIVNWIAFCSVYDPEQIESYAAWIYSQAEELKDSIEFQLGANHLLSEAKALLFAGIFLNQEEYCRFGKKVLLEEAKTQFLPDGGHYERSVSYHVESLQQYFEAYALLRLVKDEDAGKIADLMKEPYRFLNGMIGVNGRIPLFNDSAYDYPFFDAADFLSTAALVYGEMPPNGREGNYCRRWAWTEPSGQTMEWTRRSWYPNSGYMHYRFAVQGRKYSFFMDAADLGPDENPAHAHADALSILLYDEDQDIFVDSGVFTYQPGEKRSASRATKAHNTVEVDGTDSAETWGAFRVARRGHTHVLDVRESGGLYIKASYDGYKTLLKDPVEHIREVSIHGGCIELMDTLVSKELHSAVSRLHLSPGCTVEMTNPNTCLVNGQITITSDTEIVLVPCEVAGMFGIKEKAQCIELAFRGRRVLKTKIRIE